MPILKGRDGTSRFAMNPQMGRALAGGPPPPPVGGPPPPDLTGGTPPPGAGPASALGLEGMAPEDDHVEIHHGGNPEGQPPPTETTQYHTIHQGDIMNHDTYDDADAHMRDCMGETDTALGGDTGESGGGEY